MNEADMYQVTVACDTDGCDHSFDMPWDATLMGIGPGGCMYCGQCGLNNGFTVTQDPAPGVLELMNAKPYFCPLMKTYWLKFKEGEQDLEIRPNGHRGWNTKNIYPGRKITLSNGYQVPGRITRVISQTEVASHLQKAGVAQWHIDAVISIYGPRDRWLIATTREV